MELLAGYSAVQIGAALAATLGSAFVRGLTGFGMAILLVPVLALALPPVEAVVTANFLSLFIGLSEIRRLARDAEPTAWTLGGLVLLATPLGLYALSVTTPAVARLLIALIALSVYLFYIGKGHTLLIDTNALTIDGKELRSAEMIEVSIDGKPAESMGRAERVQVLVGGPLRWVSIDAI